VVVCSVLFFVCVYLCVVSHTLFCSILRLCILAFAYLSVWDTTLSFPWCERCLLITESPKTPSHYRYLIWVLVYVPYTGSTVFSLRFLVLLCILRFRVLKFVFSTLQSRSCWQLTNSRLLGGLEGSLLWIDILSFLLPIWYIFEVVCWVFSTLNTFSFVFLSCLVVLS